MENISESEQMKRIEKKIDEIMNYVAKPDSGNLNQNVNKKAIKNENRRAINKILYSLPELEDYAKLKDLSKEEIEDITDMYFQTIVMGTKDVNTTIEYSLFRDDLKEKLKTRLFVDRIHKILDSYIERETDKKLDATKRTEKYNIESLKIKKTILKRVYGYKLEPGETKVKSKEQLAEELDYSPRTIYIYQNELLDDLAPSFFGVNGLIL